MTFLRTYGIKALELLVTGVAMLAALLLYPVFYVIRAMIIIALVAGFVWLYWKLTSYLPNGWRGFVRACLPIYLFLQGVFASDVVRIHEPKHPLWPFR